MLNHAFGVLVSPNNKGYEYVANIVPRELRKDYSDGRILVGILLDAFSPDELILVDEMAQATDKEMEDVGKVFDWFKLVEKIGFPSHVLYLAE